MVDRVVTTATVEAMGVSRVLIEAPHRESAH